MRMTAVMLRQHRKPQPSRTAGLTTEKPARVAVTHRIGGKVAPPRQPQGSGRGATTATARANDARAGVAKAKLPSRPLTTAPVLVSAPRLGPVQIAIVAPPTPMPARVSRPVTRVEVPAREGPIASAIGARTRDRDSSEAGRSCRAVSGTYGVHTERQTKLPSEGARKTPATESSRVVSLAPSGAPPLSTGRSGDGRQSWSFSEANAVSGPNAGSTSTGTSNVVPPPRSASRQTAACSPGLHGLASYATGSSTTIGPESRSSVPP